MIHFLRVAVIFLIAITLGSSCGSTSNITGVECPTFDSYRTDAAYDYMKYTRHSKFISRVKKNSKSKRASRKKNKIKRSKVKHTIRAY